MKTSHLDTSHALSTLFFTEALELVLSSHQIEHVGVLLDGGSLLDEELKTGNFDRIAPGIPAHEAS